MSNRAERFSYISFGKALSLLNTENWNELGRVRREAGFLGQIACDDVICGRYVPEFSRSAVDGYALKSALTASASERTPVRIGSTSRDSGPSSCSAVNTGDPIPNGSDSVVMLEDLLIVGEDIYTLKPVRPWENISMKGEDLKPDSVIIRKGSIIRPQNNAAIMACRIREIEVFRKLVIAVLSTGDEIVSGRVPNYTQPLIRDSFSTPFTDVIDLGMVEDSADLIRKKIESGLEKCDLMIVTGGTGPSKRDLVPDILGDFGKRLFRGMKIRPGRTVSAFNAGGKLALSVSGLPVAALVSAEALIWPYIQILTGYTPERVKVKATMEEPVNANPGIRTYLRVRLRDSEDGYLCRPLEVSGSGILSTLLESSGTLVLNEDSEGINRGQVVEVELNGGV